jgi:Xaa-Pro aminopeptidase
MQKEGVALVRFWRWFEAALDQGLEIYETDLVQKMSELRLEQENCKGDSFNSIISYNEHGAIVHYSPSESTKARILPEGYLLVDTGGQYLEGTTDITRTFSLYRGATPIEFKQDYARILKGNIALTECVFPTHTRGSQLDIMARQFLWKDLLQYGHGTCHGVGIF